MFKHAHKAAVAAVAVMGLGAAVASATPTIANFDDIPQPLPRQSVFVPQTYGNDGIDWGTNQFFVEANSDYQGPTSFYHNSYGAPSGPNAISNDGGAQLTQISRDNPFNFNTVDLSSFAGLDSYQKQSATVLTITGLRLGNVVGTKTVALDDIGYHTVALNWRGVDTVSFKASGSLDPTLPNGGYFLMDNVAYTPVVYGDTNFSGKVDFADLLTLAQHYGQSGTHWEQGDFDNDGKVDFGDLLILAQHYGGVENAAQFATLSPAFQQDVKAAFAQVPEPASAALLGVAGVGLLVRRRKNA